MNSTTTIQSVMDYASSLGELQPVIPAGGYSVKTALAIATDVMSDLISQRYNFKFNRMKVPPFYTISWQQDYAQLGSTLPFPIGWLESPYWVDINNTALPKPTWMIEAVRDLEVTSISGNPPAQIAWHYNQELVQGVWPGPNQVYTNPVGVLNTTPTNPTTNILDANGNILVLTSWGTTGATAPSLPANSPEGTTVQDGSCVWTVADPYSQGFRLTPLPPQQGVCYQVNVIAQAKSPPPFTNPTQLINPIPDDYAGYFREGFVAYCYKMSANVEMRKMFPTMRNMWLGGIDMAMKQADREKDSAGFIPDRGSVSPQGGIEIGPANPYLYNIWPGR